MPTTTYAGLRYPQNSDGPFGPQQMQNLATDADTKVIVPVASPSARTALTGVPAGMMVYEQSTKRYYWWDGSAWQYAGGAPPPIVACTAAAGWNNTPGIPPGVYRDASGLVHMIGAVNPQTSYNPQDGGTHAAVQLPSGYFPTTVRTVALMVPTPAASASVWGAISTGGLLSIVGGTTNSIPSTSNHYLDNVVFHPTYNNSVPFS